MVIFMKNKKGFTLIELLAVIVILGILTTLAVFGYSKYLNQSRNKSFKILEDSFTTAVKDGVADCNTNNKNCSIFSLPDTGNTKTVTLRQVIDNGYMEIVKNPYNPDELCNYDDSYVTIENKGYTKNNLDIKYSVHLICGTHSSK